MVEIIASCGLEYIGMLDNLLFSLPANLFTKIALLRHDYAGGLLDLRVFITIFIGLLLSLALILISYFLGGKIRRFLKINFSNFNYLIDIGLGYIFFCTGIGLLGFFSLLTPAILIIYFLFISLLAFYPFINIPRLFIEFIQSCKNLLPEIRSNKFIWIWITLFILLAFATLVNPEIREDQYHVDFPRIYLNNQTIMIPPKEQLHVSAAPMLSEMSYMAGIFLWSVESARYIHFAFYLLVLLSLFEFSRIKNYKFALYTPLLFASAPVIIHETSSVYTDLQWVFFLLLSLAILLGKKLSAKEYFLSGIFLGAMLSVKLWTIIFVPVLIIYLLLVGHKFLTQTIKHILVFSLGIIGVSFIWFLRTFILTGNPLFPAFSSLSNIGTGSVQYGLSHYLGINLYLLNPANLINVFSPLFFIGICLIIYRLRNNLKFLKLNIFIFLLITFLFYLITQYIYGRYLIGLYIPLIFLASLGIYNAVSKFKLTKLFISLVLFILFTYYFINQILILPYAFGIANENNYLTSILSRDNSSYYDFGGKFNQYISAKDYVATYKIFGYYYANFKFIDVNFIFDKNNMSFYTLKKRGITKFFIKGGDINWFCQNAGISNCVPSEYSLISSYQKFPTYYLYSIK
ncbi:MAG TPA: hypothetical protein VMR59_02790 [Patescibacteria group bacterium]|nr:hypothetical protein [Patescibacteria group bacterium]